MYVDKKINIEVLYWNGGSELFYNLAMTTVSIAILYLIWVWLQGGVRVLTHLGSFGHLQICNLATKHFLFLLANILSNLSVIISSHLFPC